MKKQLRAIAKEKRKLLNTKKLSDKIYNSLISTEEYKHSKNILCYYSFGTEVETTKFFDDDSKNWYLPKIENESLIVCPYQKENLKLNKYGILEPDTLPIKNLDIIDMVIIPALMVDKNGYRIGYGKGYYDRFLSQLPHNPCRVVLTFDDLFIDCVNPDIYDEKCNIVVTNKVIYKV